ncbi:LCP family protein [Agilicoccus flavus]|uniref:LCP family protein n=1 Tax=Agilicoccus flavus TaxID=2775968 RepID=UPI001CF7059B|nr:LCP family protein [Agilicoccus flavus]
MSRFSDASDPHADGDEAVEVRRGRGSRALSNPEDLSPRMRRRRAWTLVLLTLVAPGSAQIAAGHRRLGAVAIRVWFTLLAVALGVGAIYLLRRALLLGLMTNPVVLTVVAVALLAGALLWAVLFLDALRLARLGSVGPPANRWLAAVTALLVVATSGTLAFAASNVWAGRDAVTGVFGGHTVREPSDGRYNILLMGGDSGADRTGTRPDTIMLASVDADTGRTVLFSFARDTENIDFRQGSTMRELMPEGWNCGDECLLNGLYQWAVENKDRFPAGSGDVGALATKEAVESLSGLDIQYYGLVDLKGFQRFVDAVGGLDIDVRSRVPIGGGTSPIKGYIEPGEQHLDGYHALWYARSREGSSNYERMTRQRCVTTAMMRQLTPANVVLKFRQIADVSGSVLKTDIPDGDLGRLGDLALQAKSQKITSVQFAPPLIKPWDYDPQVIRDKVEQTIVASQKAPSTGSPTPRRSATPSATRSRSSEDTPTPSASTGADADDMEAVCAAL